MVRNIFKVAGHAYEYTTNTTRSHYSTTEHATLYRDGNEVSHGTDTWLNRPWYAYRYQNAISAAVRNFFQELADQAVAEWKTTNGKRAIPRAVREEVEEPFLVVAHKLMTKINTANGVSTHKRETLKQRRARLAREERAKAKAMKAQAK
jgi:hypothetical protein